MTAASLTPGKLYRTRELAAFSANPTRWAKRLTDEGVLRQAAHGIYYLPKQTRFGPAAPTERELLRAFLGDDEFVITGSSAWNVLDLGMTGLLMVTLVYNPYRTGEFTLDGGRYWLRRVRYPHPPSAEWFVVDAFENHRMVGADPALMEQLLARHLHDGKYDRERLREAAEGYASPAARGRIRRVLEADAS
jgi:hypothetical protein